jgi:hypothetical protein
MSTPKPLVSLTIGAALSAETASSEPPGYYRRVRAISLLMNTLADGPRPLSELYALGREIGLHRSDLKLARQELGIRSFADVDGKQFWEINNDIYL